MMTQRAHPFRRSRHRWCGFSLIEIVVATLISGVLLVAALNSVVAGARRQSYVANTVRAKQLASDLMQEILQQCYQDPVQTPVFGPEPGETTGTRSKFDDVDDYVGWTESPPADKNGNPYAGFTGWTRSVNVQWADPVALTPTPASYTGLKLITVSVSYNGQTLATMIGYRSIAWADTIPSPIATNNIPPTAAITGSGGNPFSGKAPFTATLSAATSSDPNGYALSYVWNFGDGSEGNGISVTHTYSTVGAFTCTLTVYDGQGGMATVSQLITTTSH
jgi:prepilin-type N-terminal cleavage/methylation domain-containing protein